MRRILIFLLISAFTLLMNSCASGCGCPGGAGYTENTIETINQNT